MYIPSTYETLADLGDSPCQLASGISFIIACPENCCGQSCKHSKAPALAIEGRLPNRETVFVHVTQNIIQNSTEKKKKITCEFHCFESNLSKIRPGAD